MLLAQCTVSFQKRHETLTRSMAQHQDSSRRNIVKSSKKAGTYFVKKQEWQVTLASSCITSCEVWCGVSPPQVPCEAVIHKRAMPGSAAFRNPIRTAHQPRSFVDALYRFLEYEN